jgi:hypothetical protein
MRRVRLFRIDNKNAMRAEDRLTGDDGRDEFD